MREGKALVCEDVIGYTEGEREGGEEGKREGGRERERKEGEEGDRGREREGEREEEGEGEEEEEGWYSAVLKFVSQDAADMFYSGVCVCV